MKKIVLLLTSALIASCGEPNLDQIHQGKYYWGPEVNSFSPCNSDNTYWVSYNWAGMEMSQYYKENASAPYQPIYFWYNSDE